MVPSDGVWLSSSEDQDAGRSAGCPTRDRVGLEVMEQVSARSGDLVKFSVMSGAWKVVGVWWLLIPAAVKSEL